MIFLLLLPSTEPTVLTTVSFMCSENLFGIKIGVCYLRIPKILCVMMTSAFRWQFISQIRSKDLAFLCVLISFWFLVCFVFFLVDRLGQDDEFMHLNMNLYIQIEMYF